MVVDGSASDALADWFQRHVLDVFEPLCMRTDPTNKLRYMRNWAHLKTARTILPYLRDPDLHHSLMVFGSDGGELQISIKDQVFGAVTVYATKQSWSTQSESEEWQQAFDAAARDVEGLPLLLSRSGVTFFDPKQSQNSCRARRRGRVQLQVHLDQQRHPPYLL